MKIKQLYVSTNYSRPHSQNMTIYICKLSKTTFYEKKNTTVVLGHSGKQKNIKGEVLPAIKAEKKMIKTTLIEPALGVLVKSPLSMYKYITLYSHILSI